MHRCAGGFALFAHALTDIATGGAMLSNRYDPIVLAHRTVFMQRLADFVRLGYRDYVAGEVRLDRAPALAAKLRRLYEVHLHRNQRARARAAGEASAYALWWQPHADTVAFVLLLTPGLHAARQLERLRDATSRDGRFVLGDCELVQRAREGQARPSWTWRLTAQAYEGWRAYVLQTVRSGNDYAVQRLVDDLTALPGFAGIRVQGKQLRRLLRAEWRRRRPGQQPPQLPRQRFVQRLANRGTRLSQLVRERAGPNLQTHHPTADSSSETSSPSPRFTG